VSPHPGRRHEQADEALAGRRDLHRLHRHAAAEERTAKLRTQEIFGTYIHTYKFHEAVADKVVLDLKYEARDVPQRLTSPKTLKTTSNAEDQDAEQFSESHYP
jgi:type I site-specific restriction-modification system R (restriction) subunit